LTGLENKSNFITPNGDFCKRADDNWSAGFQPAFFRGNRAQRRQDAGAPVAFAEVSNGVVAHLREPEERNPVGIRGAAFMPLQRAMFLGAWKNRMRFAGWAASWTAVAERERRHRFRADERFAEFEWFARWRKRRGAALPAAVHDAQVNSHAPETSAYFH
jgi:hypothetical protein